MNATRRYQVTVWVDVPFEDDGDGTPAAPRYTAKELEKYLARRLSVKWEPDCDVEVLDYEDLPADSVRSQVGA